MKAKQAARAFNRIMAPITAVMAEAAHADAWFDGGEWSSSAHDRLYEDEEQRVLQLVADRFGIGLGVLCHQLQENDYRGHDEMVESHSLLGQVIRAKIKLGCADRLDALEDIKLSLDSYGPYQFAKMFHVLKDDSAEEFMIQFMTAFNRDVRHTY